MRIEVFPETHVDWFLTVVASALFALVIALLQRWLMPESGPEFPDRPVPSDDFAPELEPDREPRVPGIMLGAGAALLVFVLIKSLGSAQGSSWVEYYSLSYAATPATISEAVETHYGLKVIEVQGLGQAANGEPVRVVVARPGSDDTQQTCTIVTKNNERLVDTLYKNNGGPGQ